MPLSHRTDGNIQGKLGALGQGLGEMHLVLFGVEEVVCTVSSAGITFPRIPFPAEFWVSRGRGVRSGREK